MTTLSLSQLETITGGNTQTRRAAAPSSQAQQVCNRTQFDWMAAHMVPDSGLQPGVQRHVVAHDAAMCGFPMPKR